MVEVYSVVVAYDKHSKRGETRRHIDHLGWRRSLHDARKLGRRAAEVMARALGSARYSVALAASPEEIIDGEVIRREDLRRSQGDFAVSSK